MLESPFLAKDPISLGVHVLICNWNLRQSELSGCRTRIYFPRPQPSNMLCCALLPDPSLDNRPYNFMVPLAIGSGHLDNSDFHPGSSKSFLITSPVWPLSRPKLLPPQLCCGLWLSFHSLFIFGGGKKEGMIEKGQSSFVYWALLLWRFSAPGAGCSGLQGQAGTCGLSCMYLRGLSRNLFREGSALLLTFCDPPARHTGLLLGLIALVGCPPGCASPFLPGTALALGRLSPNSVLLRSASALEVSRRPRPLSLLTTPGQAFQEHSPHVLCWGSLGAGMWQAPFWQHPPPFRVAPQEPSSPGRGRQERTPAVSPRTASPS